ncbi:hypothetical protein LTR85_008340 [Meristemomyces frigidus]|nr:hypothetical protein LTR85_008340 [Meristemomyces frigidus]
MLDQEVDITGWHAEWITRTLPAFETYTTIVVNGLSVAILVLALIGFFGIRRNSKELKANPDNRAAIFKKINKRVKKSCRGHWAIANVYMLNVVVIAMVDAYIGISAISKDVNEHPSNWTRGAITEVAMYCLFLLVVFATTWIVVPLLQMLLITYSLARFAKKRGVSTLADYIPEARMWSTHIAQIWSMACFFIVAWWVPDDGTSFWRFVVIQASVGSAVAWLDASFAFNFRANMLAEDDFKVSTGGVKEIVRMFARAAKATHMPEKQSCEVLPRYEDLPQKADGEVTGDLMSKV